MGITYGDYLIDSGYRELTPEQEDAMTEARMEMTEQQIRHMVDRFLGWKLPSSFSPDAGISYTRPNYAASVDATPSGTNLFDAAQAEAMVRYMIEGMPDAE